ncbi:ATP-dependent RNA helicase HrpA [Microlunatus panaciterrae]|uniref:ATP-dependent helicase HrpA n=1 Tax=Microlunatus panaciterrae TaxID=400768 RepID=A0ABS2RQ68_9ACTN|nr:ATP-dependent RNA helicase HrpA [Microlunatus panaciterrae]MBM7800632.1 ATP-dependent helicase HrpA [Microlunatus panaciterrae]
MSIPTLEPQITFDEDLPITAWRDRIAEAIQHHQVVVVAGETGSGKTTQLPKICLQLGRRTIAHTQPRRIAARSVAERIAEELRTPLGDLVGYQVRFTRKASAATKLKVMTDGVLLAEIGHDRDLRHYDTIIIDEAHERSLNIDFLLGYLKQLLARRRDLKVIVTSATIDTARFSEHFDGAPIIEVSGRTYPVELRYRPIYDDGQDSGTATDPNRDQIEGICDAVKELSALGTGDILVFLSGEREIRDTAEAVEALKLRFTEVLPLYARLSSAEQHRVFSAHTGRRVVLATNVAETSLTVPGIRYVIDAGTARISRYSARTKVQRLPIEPVSQASANQRAGRCGRVAPGVCIRLYSEDDFAGRPEFTEPEILRTNLASVILQMAAADLGDIAAFPFVEAPDSAQITDGLRLLDELGALATNQGQQRSRGRGRQVNRNGGPELTGIGRRLAAIPLDPRMGRMILAGERLGCLREMLIIVSGLSIQDPRERPAEKREQADALHRRFWAALEGPEQKAEETTKSNGPRRQQRDGAKAQTTQATDGSDFMALLRLWDHLKTSQKSLSGNAFRRMCRDEFLHFLRVREWQDLHAQLRDITRELKLERNHEPAPADRIHTAILTGLLSHVGLADLRDEPKPGTPGARRGRPGPREYLGARGARFAINPGSSVAKTQPPLVMAAELVETTRLWARTVAGIDAAWVEEVGGHLLKRNYSEPHWSSKSGSVMAYETVSLYGVPVISRRRVSYGRVDPVLSREIFIRAALVEGQWRTRHRFFADNERLRAEAADLEERTRRRDIVVDDQAIFEFYDQRIPADVVSAAHFDRWWKTSRAEHPDLLTMSLDDLVTGRSELDSSAFPDHWDLGDLSFKISYSFDPGSPRDGVSVEVPLSLLNQINGATFSWQVPGLRVELATEMIRSLPKSVRRMLVPAPDFAARAVEWLRGQQRVPEEAFAGALSRALRALTGEVISEGDWDLERLPDHVRITFVITDASGVQAEGKDLAALRRMLEPKLAATLNSAGAELRRSGATSWIFGEIPAEVELQRGGHRVVGYPALVDEGTTVGLVVSDNPERQAASHRSGLRRLVLLNTPDPTKWVVGHLGNADKLALGHSPYPSVPALLADARLASVGELVRRTVGEQRPGDQQVRTETAFSRLCDQVRGDNADLMRDIVNTAAEILRRDRAIRLELPAVQRISEAAVGDMTLQLDNLVFTGFLAATRQAQLTDLVRYLRAIELRIATLKVAPARDAAGLATISAAEDAYAELCGEIPPGPLPADVAAIGWMLEELRVSLFAQSLGTRFPVSAKRLQSAISQARSGLGPRR